MSRKQRPPLVLDFALILFNLVALVFFTNFTTASAAGAPAGGAPNASIAPLTNRWQPTAVLTDTSSSVYLPIVGSAIELLPEWTAAWWQWVERTNNVPVEGQGNVDCTLGQTGDLWFLAGTQGGAPVVRNCTVPGGKILFVPLITYSWSNEGSENLTVAEKRQLLAAIFSETEPGVLNSKPCYLESTVDGVSVAYGRLQSPPFSLHADPEAVSDGYWFAFGPAEGEHLVHFSGIMCDFVTNVPVLTVDVTYNLTVQAPSPARH